MLLTAITATPRWRKKNRLRDAFNLDSALVRRRQTYQSITRRPAPAHDLALVTLAKTASLRLK